MKENILEALVYLFENHVNDNWQLLRKDDSLYDELADVGFQPQTITKALDWIEGLLELRKSTYRLATAEQRSIRVFTPYEQARLTTESQSMLLHLKQIGIVNPMVFEMIVDRLMELENYFIDINDVKLVTLMVLSDQPSLKTELARMEELVLDDTEGSVH